MDGWDKLLKARALHEYSYYLEEETYYCQVITSNTALQLMLIMSKNTVSMMFWEVQHAVRVGPHCCKRFKDELVSFFPSRSFASHPLRPACLSVIALKTYGIFFFFFFFSNAWLSDPLTPTCSTKNRRSWSNLQYDVSWTLFPKLWNYSHF